MLALLTEATCGEACWCATEDVCRCSCGGRNHGCLRGAHGVRPTRTAKIDGYRYELAAVGEVGAEASRLIEAAGKYAGHGGYTYYWRETDKGSPVRVKCATRAQIAAWPELASYRENKPWESTYILWVRCDTMPERVAV